MDRGKIIAISGMDGSGKTTVVNYIKDFCKRNDLPYVITRQPMYGIKKIEEFGKILNNKSPEFEFSLVGGFVAWGRLNTQEKEVIPAIDAGKIIICERYISDIYAWSLFRGAKEEWIKAWISPLLKEDLQILCDSSPETIYQRLSTRNEKHKIGEDSIENITKLVELYRDLFHKRNGFIYDTNNEIQSGVNISIIDDLMQALIS